MNVSGSILAVKSNYLEYAEMLRYANVDYLHIDIFQDGGNFSIRQLDELESAHLPLDVHLIFEDISWEDIKILNRVNAKYLNVQYEALKDKSTVAYLSKMFDGNFGIAITSASPLCVVDENIDYISQVLFMCSEPGVTGAEFDASNFDRIERVHKRYPSLRLCADGGINDSIGEKMGRLGVSVVVSGSYLCRDVEKLGASTYRLKYMNEREINVTRSMIKLNSLPLLGKNELFPEIVDKMNRYKLGMVFIVEDGKLEGVVADGDIRRGFLEYGERIFKKTAQELMNRQPFVVGSDAKMDEIFNQLSIMHKGIDVIPVMDGNRLVGALDLKIGI